MDKTDQERALYILPAELEGPFWNDLRKRLASEMIRCRIHTNMEWLKKHQTDPQHAYEAYKRAMHEAFPDDYPLNFEPWSELDAREQAAWVAVVSR